jgi:plastocyanin
MNRKLIALFALLSLLLLAALIGCGKKDETTDQSTSPSEQTKPATPIDKSQVATVSGAAKFDGTAPKPTKIDMSQDPACKKAGGDNMTETVVADDGNLANVFVYVKEGLPANQAYEMPKDKVVVDQEGCRYHPHVLGVMAGQTVEIRNSDNTTHNIHPSPKDNKEWNESQPPKGAPLEKNFARQEILIPVKCNQHPWMKMYLGVVKHPYFAVTDKDGKFSIKDLPPGDYTLAAVHEKFGEQTMKVKVEPKADMKDQNFTFKAGAAAGGSQ